MEAILTGEDKIGRSLGEMNFDSSGVREIYREKYSRNTKLEEVLGEMYFD